MGCDVDGGRMQEKIPLMRSRSLLAVSVNARAGGRLRPRRERGWAGGRRQSRRPHSGWNLIQATVLKPNSQLRVCAGAGH